MGENVSSSSLVDLFTKWARVVCCLDGVTVQVLRLLRMRFLRDTIGVLGSVAIIVVSEKIVWMYEYVWMF